MSTATLGAATVPLGTLKEGQAFICPWRPKEGAVGRVIANRSVSVYVHVARQECDGWEHATWASSTEVVPCDLSLYHKQGFGKGQRNSENRSTVESPVEMVHSICDEMEGAERDEIVAECVSRGVNENTAKTQYYAWRKKQ